QFKSVADASALGKLSNGGVTLGGNVTDSAEVAAIVADINEIKDAGISAITLTAGQLASNGVAAKLANNAVTLGAVTSNESDVITHIAKVKAEGISSMSLTDSQFSTAASSKTDLNAALTDNALTVTVAGATGAIDATGYTKALKLNGASGNDVLTGGGGNDIITGGAGADSINVGTGTDWVVLRDNDSGANNATGSSVSTNGMDIYTGLGVGDKLEIYRSVTWNFFSSVATSTSSVAGQNDAIVFTRGTYNSSENSFTAGASGADSLVTYDVLMWGDSSTGVDYEAIVLVGFVGQSDVGISSSGRGATVTLSELVG
ncbi:MAG: hypothetical protein GX086_03170, partial [Alcaligenaceae bacterium]|nr:hypothetical protein [Alcaligenaceae bacterium]